MTTKPTKSVLRLRKRHASLERGVLDAVDGRKLQTQQSMRDAIVAAIVVVILFSVLWAMFSTLLGRIFPWFTIILGYLVGIAVRRAGRGVDWRFPTLAAMATVVGALAAHVVVSAASTAESLGASTIDILGAITAMTWPVFFGETISAADVVYALFGAGVAAFYANRRLNRAEYHALRKWREEAAGEG